MAVNRRKKGKTDAPNGKAVATAQSGGANKGKGDEVVGKKRKSAPRKETQAQMKKRLQLEARYNPVLAKGTGKPESSDDSGSDDDSVELKTTLCYLVILVRVRRKQIVVPKRLTHSVRSWRR